MTDSPQREGGILQRIKDWWLGAVIPAAAVTASAGDTKPKGLPSSPEALAAARRSRGQITAQQVFSVPRPPPGVIPKRAEKRVQLAMDEAQGEMSVWAAGTYASGWFDGPLFIGYPALSLLAVLPEYRRLAEILATECTREWIELLAGDDDTGEKAQKISKLEAELKRIDLRGHIAQQILMDAFFGLSHLYLDVGTDPDDRKELKLSIGNGRDAETQVKFAKRTGFLKGLKSVEPVWCYPSKYNATNPLRDDWYRPESWFVQGFEVHSTRLLTFIGRDVPDLLKPAYMFGGVSLSQLMKPYVDRWITVVQAVADVIVSFSTSGIKTNLETSLKPTGGGMSIFERIELFNLYRTNRGAMVLDKESEEFFQFNTPLSSLDELVSKYQEFLCVSGDTLIETRRGQIPITDVRQNDHVWTRDGWAPIDWVGRTGHANLLVEIETPDSTIRVTPCHPIFRQSGQQGEFVDARSVRPGDLLNVRAVTKTDMASLSFGAVVGGHVGSTATSRPSTLNSISASIARFGSLISGQSRRAMTSITWTKTAATILSKTWHRLVGTITPTFTWPMVAWASPSLKRPITPAWSAEKPSESRSAKVAARQERAVSSCIAAQPAAYAPTDCVVLSVRLLRADEDVFNLKVADGYLPEFYANGILTHNCSISGTPVVKLLGIQPAGLNSSSQGEITSWLDWCEAFRQKFCGPAVTTIIDFAQLSIFGEVDPDITWKWENLRSLDPKEETERLKIGAETDATYSELGAISPQEIRAKILRDPESPYFGIDEVAEEEDDLIGPEGQAVDPEMAAQFPQLGAPTESGMPASPSGGAEEPTGDPRQDRRAAGEARERPDDDQGPRGERRVPGEHELTGEPRRSRGPRLKVRSGALTTREA